MEKHIILLVEDSPEDAYLVQRFIEKNLTGDFNVMHKETMAAAVACLKAYKDDIGFILLDLGLPDTNGGHDTLGQMRKYAPEIYEEEKEKIEPLIKRVKNLMNNQN